jgi:hypothetical protein
MVKIKICNTPAILPAVLYGCETCPFTLMEEHRLWVFQNSVLRRTFESKSTGKLQSDEYCSSSLPLTIRIKSRIK